MPAANKVLEKMLDRLLASLTSGPSLNCRPHHSRQRVDFATVAKLADLSPEEALNDLLGNDREVKLTARVATPKRAANLGRRRGGKRANGNGGEPTPPENGEAAKQEKLTPAERAWLDQQALLNKFRIIADDARTYEQDTGVHVLNLGFPILSLPPGTFAGAGGARSASRRVLAPIAFVPVAVTLGGGAAPTVKLACRGEGLDLVVPNVALLAWLEQQTGKAAQELFVDEEGDDPWREIGSLVRHVCESLELPVPPAFSPTPPSPDEEAADVAEAEKPEAAPAAEATPEPTGEVPFPNESGLEAADEENAQRSAPNRDPAGDELTGRESETASDGHPATLESDPSPTPEPPPLVRASNGHPLRLVTCPRTDDEDEDGPKASVIVSAVVGLFPMANQGLLRDMQAMAGGAEPLIGPVQSFIDVGASFEEAPDPADVSPAPQVVPQRPRVFADERLVTAADPCQSRAVRLARQSRGLVVHGPPGTGKSQTIANIIGDHLAREQRVLLVCEKRTALDVVADRLDHMGLGQLCALIHDPQRDQRDLYMDVRQQLETLPEATTDDGAEGKLAKTDAELQKLHAELTAHHKALMARGAGGDSGTSFHDLVGQWLALSPADVIGRDEHAREGDQAGGAAPRSPGPDVSLDPALLAQTNLAEVDHRSTELRDLLDRAGSVGYPENPWTVAAGVALPQLLGRPIESVRDMMANALRAARAADDTADRAIPPFPARQDVVKVAAARAALAEQLDGVASRVDGAVASRWATADAAGLQRLHAKLAETDPFAQIFRAGPLDAELALTTRDRLPAVADINAQLTTLATYLEVARKWWGFVAFSKNSAAAAVLNKFGLTRSAENAERAQKFLVALRARILLAAQLRELAGTTESASLPGDDAIEKQLADHAAVAVLRAAVADQPLVSPLAQKVADALADPHPRGAFLAGLRASQTRAASIVNVENVTTSAGLFATDWSGGVFARLRNGSVEAANYDDLSDRLDTLEGVVRVRAALEAVPASIRAAADSLVAQQAPPDAGLTVLRREVLAVEIRRRLEADPSLQGIDAQRLRAAFDRYRQLDADKKKLVQAALLHRWTQKQRDRLLAVGGNRLSGLGADLKRRLTTRGQRAMRLRQVLAVGKGIEGGDPIFDLRPVWMASPETVAQIFPREVIFDVVVFDEASQCRLEEALPVLLRGKRVTIAGDPKQLPPTRFFESAVVRSDEDDEITTDQQLFEQQQGETEDLLQAALGLDIQQCYLDVHYRSRNAELIEFSNEHFYDSRLQAIPGHPKNRAPVPPLSLYRTNGTYDKRVNEAEADKVCEIVKDLLKRAEPPSIGIACFNLAQRDLIVEALDEMAEEDKAFAKRLAEARVRKGAGSFEGLFVKNLENVQGDERDHIIISTTYGPDAKGKFYRRFGPLGMEGGGRRLNVLVTRARQEVHLVTSIPGEAYRALPPVPQGQTPGGGYLLFSYLQYAEELENAYAVTRAASEQVDSSAQRRTDVAPQASDEQTVETSQWEQGISEEATAKPRSDSEAAGSAPGQPAVRERMTKAPSALARSLAAKLVDARGVGSDVHWGNEGFCVDLALHHPTRPGDVTVGVLCDAARFAASEDPVEWDVFRTGVLESQGWRLHRLWSPHFFRDPAGSVTTIMREARAELAADGARDGIRVSRGGRSGN